VSTAEALRVPELGITGARRTVPEAYIGNGAILFGGLIGRLGVLRMETISGKRRK